MLLRWGIVGAGAISHDFVVALHTLPATEHQVSCVAARSLDRAKMFAKKHNIDCAYGSYAELANDGSVDVIYIGVITSEHYELCKLFLNAGKHVLCEKPLTLFYQQTRQLIALARKGQLFFMEGAWSRFFPIYQEVRSAIDNGTVGDVVTVSVTFSVDLRNVERLQKKALGGGATFDIGVYAVQFANWVMNEYPYKIVAAGTLNSDGVDESVGVTLLYSKNRIANLRYTMAVKEECSAFICGTDGAMKVLPFWCPTHLEIFPKESLGVIQGKPARVIKTDLPKADLPFNFLNSGGLVFEAEEVRRCIMEGLLESRKMTHADSENIAKIMDEVLQAVGVNYSKDDSQGN